MLPLGPLSGGLGEGVPTYLLNVVLGGWVLVDITDATVTIPTAAVLLNGLNGFPGPVTILLIVS